MISIIYNYKSNILLMIINMHSCESNTWLMISIIYNCKSNILLMIINIHSCESNTWLMISCIKVMKVIACG